eukprot:29818-Eustigmatos_ZCMA.PRE.1
MHGDACRAAVKMRAMALSESPTTRCTTSGHSIDMKLAYCLASAQARDMVCVTPSHHVALVLVRRAYSDLMQLTRRQRSCQ